ncbi:MAG: hypothetical protein KDB80_00145 [Planctomycetes bacterium]|nr:hypothetical protein [Planctomycetota bacterium]
MRSAILLTCFTFAVTSAESARAQCRYRWLPGSSGDAISAPLEALATLPSGEVVGAGVFDPMPMSSHLLSCGLFDDDGSWTPLLYSSGPAHSLVVHPDGALIVGGSFLLPYPRIARLGTNGVWGALGPGIPEGSVFALTVARNGDIVAGGSFSDPGDGVARWTGTAWAPMDLGVTCKALAVIPAGPIGVVAGGSFPGFLRGWNGTSWQMLGGVEPDGEVRVLLTLPNGDLIAGGDFTAIGAVAANRIARWDGAVWSPLGSGLNGGVRALRSLPNGGLLVGGVFTSAGGIAAPRLARWQDSAWRPETTGVDDSVYALTTSGSGMLFAGGSFTTAGGSAAQFVARAEAPCDGGCHFSTLPTLTAPASATASFGVTCPPPTTGCSFGPVILFGQCSAAPIELPPPLGCGPCGMIVSPSWGTLPDGVVFGPGLLQGLTFCVQCGCISTAACIDLSRGLEIEVGP